VGDFANSRQVHDFEPGIAPSGLFWTTRIGRSAVDARPERGTGRMRATLLSVGDYHDFPSSMAANPTPVPSQVSFDVRWLGGGPPRAISDDTFGFAGTYVETDAHIDFTARQRGSHVTYRSHPGDQITVSGGTGIERTGVFAR